MDDGIKKIYNQAADKWGIDHQLLKLGEECAELAVECIKTTTDKEKRMLNLIEEMADVSIMLEQVSYLLGIGQDIITERETKLERLRRRVNEKN